MKVQFTEKEFSAGALSPLIGGPVFAFLALISTDSTEPLWAAILGAFITAGIAIPFSYMGAIFIGIPVVYFLKKIGANKPKIISISGFAVIYVLMILNGAGFSDQTAFTFSICGLAVSSLYSVLSK